MKKNIGKIDFNELVTKEDLQALTEEKREFALKEGNYHANYLRNQYSPEMLVELLASRARELAFIGFKYKDENMPTKELIASTITYPNTETFIQILIEKGISYAGLFSYSKLISKTKKLTLLADELELDLAEDVQLASKKLNNLCALFRKYYGHSDYNLILTKVNYIVAFEKDLYKKLEAQIKPQEGKTR